MQLVKATLIALAVAVILLVVAILPAEYGIDPTGLGKGLGLTALNGTEPAGEEIAPTEAGAMTTGAAVVRTPGVFGTEEKIIELPPYEGVELKATMTAGQSFVFNWTTSGGELFVDMHGEPHGAADDEFTSYWKENSQGSAQGNFVASFDGTHGWYWQNMNEEPVTITVQVSGFYENIYQP